MRELKPCPVCGKQPKVIYRTIGPTGWEITVQCKPLLFGKAHKKTTACAANVDWALEKACGEWEEKI